MVPDLDVGQPVAAAVRRDGALHFLFVPLTLGLSWILFIMESVYVMTGRIVYRDMTKFWASSSASIFAMGVTTGITLEFQFGTNWSYYSH